MGAFAIRRALLILGVFLAATLLVFVAVTALPGDPLNALSGGRRLSDPVREALTARYHLDDPVWTRWASWLVDVVRGDLGQSISTRRPVRDVIADALPVSVALAILTLTIEGVIGVAAGVLAAAQRRRFLDSLVLVSTTVTMAVPVIVLAALVRSAADRSAAVSLGAGGIAGLLLPALVLAAPALALVARLTRASMIDETEQAYVTTARAQGLTAPRILFHHTLRNSWAPIIAFLAVDFAALLAGAVVVEAVFDVHGIGRALYLAIGSRDQPVIIGITVVLIGAYLVVNLVADLLTAALDPRVRDE